MSRSVLARLALTLAVGALLPSSAFSHTGGDDFQGFLHGLSHPAGGLDHACAMLAVGLWAAQVGGRSIWLVPLTFVGVMGLGVALPLSGNILPFVEQSIPLSIFLLGVMIAAAIRPPLALSSSIVGLFALWHGHAHGAEIPAFDSGVGYALGFMLATALLHAIGILSGLAMQRASRGAVINVAGASMALCGVYLAAA